MADVVGLRSKKLIQKKSPWLLYVALGFALLLAYILIYVGVESFNDNEEEIAVMFPKNITTSAFFPRKILQSTGDDGDTNRIGATCSKDDILIFQGPSTPLPSGIPSYTVQILNSCVSGCSISNIHLSCGWFSSARLINPLIFRRVCFDDCIVNNGDALGPGQTLSFQYANTYRYPLYVSTVSCS